MTNGWYSINNYEIFLGTIWGGLERLASRMARPGSSQMVR